MGDFIHQPLIDQFTCLPEAESLKVMNVREIARHFQKMPTVFEMETSHRIFCLDPLNWQPYLAVAQSRWETSVMVSLKIHI